MPEAFLTVENLHKNFNEHKAVNGISFTIYKGEIFGLLGPNGAGKTTSIRILSTVLEPDRGDVIIGGHSIRQDAGAVRRLIGVCPQELALYADLSALENLLFFGLLWLPPRCEELQSRLDGRSERNHQAALFRIRPNQLL